MSASRISRTRRSSSSSRSSTERFASAVSLTRCTRSRRSNGSNLGAKRELISLLSARTRPNHNVWLRRSWEQRSGVREDGPDVRRPSLRADPRRRSSRQARRSSRRPRESCVACAASPRRSRSRASADPPATGSGGAEAFRLGPAPGAPLPLFGTTERTERPTLQQEPRAGTERGRARGAMRGRIGDLDRASGVLPREGDLAAHLLDERGRDEGSRYLSTSHRAARPRPRRARRPPG